MNLQEQSNKNIRHLVKLYHINDAILKVDCEGCEYDMILDTPQEVIEKTRERYIAAYKQLTGKNFN